MVMTAIVPTPAEAITTIIIIVVRLYPNLLADLLRPPQALAPPTAWNPSSFSDGAMVVPSEGEENGAAFATPIGIIAAQPVIRPAGRGARTIGEHAS